MSDGTYDPLFTGDIRDDDPQVLDSLVQQQAEPLPPPITTLVNPPALMRPPSSIIIGGTRNMTPGESAMQLLPADPNRVALYFWLTGSNGSCSVLIGDSRNQVESEMISPRLFLYNIFPFPGHTGEVWARPFPDPTDAFVLSWWSVSDPYAQQ